MDIYMIGYYVQQAIFVVCGKILGFDYLCIRMDDAVFWIDCSDFSVKIRR